MAQRDRSWRRHHARSAEGRLEAAKAWIATRFDDPAAREPPARPHAAQKARVWWSTEQEMREAA